MASQGMAQVVATQKNTSGGGTRIVVRPNRSMSWHDVQLVYVAMVAAGLMIATGLALAGAWLVFPFAGLELVAVGACFYRSAQRCAEREVISIDDGLIAVERGRYRPMQRFELPRQWAQVGLQQGAVRGYPCRVLIRAHGRAVEVGSRLAESERRLLARRLRRCLGADSSQHEFA